jgi:hypothetical protein
LKNRVIRRVQIVRLEEDGKKENVGCESVKSRVIR